MILSLKRLPIRSTYILQPYTTYAFMMGLFSQICGDNPIGQYGEGLKLAILILSDKSILLLLLKQTNAKFEV